MKKVAHLLQGYQADRLICHLLLGRSSSIKDMINSRLVVSIKQAKRWL